MQYYLGSPGKKSLNSVAGSEIVMAVVRHVPWVVAMGNISWVIAMGNMPWVVEAGILYFILLVVAGSQSAIAAIRVASSVVARVVAMRGIPVVASREVAVG